MSRLNQLSFFLISATGIFTTIAYGTVHQPLIALFYLIVTAILLLWSAESWRGGSIRFSRSPLQIP
ncbi:MAG: hypothetical protein ABIV48_01725, partial [Pyrinomonadaceae bacterium]